MAALTANRDASRKESDLVAYQVGANTNIYRHALVGIQAADGYAYPARSGTPTDAFVGVADVSAHSTAAGATLVQVKKTGSYLFATTGALQTDIGATVYAADDQTVTKTATNNVAVGTIVEVPSATVVRVRINGSVK